MQAYVFDSLALNFGDLHKLSAALCGFVCNNAGQGNTNAHVNVNRRLLIVNKAFYKFAHHFLVRAAVSFGYTV